MENSKDPVVSTWAGLTCPCTVPISLRQLTQAVSEELLSIQESLCSHPKLLLLPLISFTVVFRLFVTSLLSSWSSGFLGYISAFLPTFFTWS